MKLKILYCFTIFIFQIINNLYSQESTFQIGVHHSSHQLEDLSSILKNQVSIADLPVFLKVVNDYPNSNGINIGINKRFKEKYELGVFYLLNSSGGSATYSDYSGEIKYEHLILAHSIGVKGTNYLFKKKRLQSLINLNAGATFSSLDFIFFAQILGIKDETKISFKSFGIDIYPEIEFRYFIPVLQVQSFLFLSFGYNLNIPSNIFLKSNKDAYLLTDDGNNATANWSGIRAKIGLGISIN